MISDYHDEEVDWPPKPAPKPKKKKEPSSDGDATQPSPKKAKKTIEIPDDARVVEMGQLRDIAEELSERLRGMGYNVPDADSARQQCGPVCRECLVDGVLDVGAVLKGMAAKWGLKETIECVVAENAPLAGVFKELSSFEYKKGDNIKGTAQEGVGRARGAHEDARRARRRRSSRASASRPRTRSTRFLFGARSRSSRSASRASGRSRS